MNSVISEVFEYFDHDETENPCWEDFHEKHPDIERWEYELGVKAYQEM